MQQQQTSFVHQQTTLINSLTQPSYFTQQTQQAQTQQPYVVSPSGMSSSQGDAKRKRVQVPAACAQCKRAHAACSNTRPCDRCVRINQAEACVSSHLASMRATTPAKQDNVPQASRPLAYDINAPPPIILAPNSIPFNENDVSRFLFEETNVEQFPEFPEHFECMEPDSPCALSSSSSSTCSSPAQPQSTPSPQTYPSPPQHTQSHTQHVHAQQMHQPAQQIHQPAQQIHQPAQQMHQPAQQIHQPAQQTLYPVGQQSPFVMVDQQVPLPSVGPSPSAVAATITAQNPHAAHAPHSGAGAMQTDAVSEFKMPPQHSMTPVSAPSNMMEVMVNELIQQNKKMESMLMSLGSEMKTLKQEMTSIKQAGNPMVSVAKVEVTSAGPATAVWTVNDGMLIEHNQKFAQLLDLIEVPKGYSMQHFFGGPCSKAASHRMNHHLENIKNSQPVTDYAVIERKRVNGDVMRLMIVVNVVPTTTPVFITTMYEI